MQFCFKDMLMAFVNLFFATPNLSKWGVTFGTNSKNCLEDIFVTKDQSELKQ